MGAPPGTQPRTAAYRWRSLRTRQSSAASTRPVRTACVTQNTCSPAQTSTHSTQCTKRDRTRTCSDCPDWRRSTTPTCPAPSCPSRPRRGWVTKLLSGYELQNPVISTIYHLSTRQQQNRDFLHE